MSNDNDNSKFPAIPRKDATKVLHKKIRDLYKLDYSYNEICKMLNISKVTVFFAIKGRAKRSKIIKNRKD